MASRAHIGTAAGHRGILRALGLSGALPAVSAVTRQLWAGRIVAGALALGMLLAPSLWLSRSGADSFPLVAPLPALETLALPAPLDWGLYGAVLALCALSAAVPRRAVFTFLFAAILLLALPDMMRWQPWVFLYGGILGTLAFVPARTPTAPRLLAWVEPLRILRIIVASVYLWSGANKMNASFFKEGLSGFLVGMPPAISSGPVAETLTYSAPFVEIAAGAGLILGGLAGMPRVRYGALALAASTNLFVLTALISSGANTVVYPWNIAMIALIFVLFAGRDGKEPHQPQRSLGRRTRRHTARLWGYIYAGVVLVLFAVMPLVGVLGYWPSYLSWALYSENTSGATVKVDGTPTDVAALAYEQLNVPAYPFEQVYEAVGERACGAGELAPRGSGETVLTIRERPDILSGERESREYSCGTD